MDQQLTNSYKQLKLLADALQGQAPVAAATFVMNMRQKGTGEEVPVLCVALDNPRGDGQTAVIQLAVLVPLDEKLFEDPSSDECREAMEASLHGVAALGGGCLCGRCNRFPRDDSDLED